jgi:hypothetical protein
MAQEWDADNLNARLRVLMWRGSQVLVLVVVGCPLSRPFDVSLFGVARGRGGVSTLGRTPD